MLNVTGNPIISNQLFAESLHRQFFPAGAAAMISEPRRSEPKRSWRGPQIVVPWWRDQSEPPLEGFLQLGASVFFLVKKTLFFWG